MGDVPLRKNRDFVLLQLGQLLSATGSRSTGIAYSLLVLSVSHSPLDAGLVGFANIIPSVFLGPIAGLVVDRVPRKPLMMTADVVRSLAMFSIVIVIWLGSITVIQIAGVAFLDGAMFLFFYLAELGASRSVVPDSRLVSAMATRQARDSTVNLVAPSLGGSLFALARAAPFLLAALAPAFSLASLAVIRSSLGGERMTETVSLRAQISDGFRFLWNAPFIRVSALVQSGLALITSAMSLVIVVIAQDQGFSSAAVGGVLAILGGCSLVGSLAAPTILRWLSLRMVLVARTWLLVAVVGYILVPSVYVLLMCSLPAAMIGPAAESAIVAHRLGAVPGRLVGRVNSVSVTIQLCCYSLGPLMAGVLLSQLSGRSAVVVLAVLSCALSAAVSISPSVRNAPTDAVPVRSEASTRR